MVLLCLFFDYAAAEFKEQRNDCDMARFMHYGRLSSYSLWTMRIIAFRYEILGLSKQPSDLSSAGFRSPWRGEALCYCFLCIAKQHIIDYSVLCSERAYLTPCLQRIFTYREAHDVIIHVSG